MTMPSDPHPYETTAVEWDPRPDEKLSGRFLMFASACLLVVLIVMAFALVYATTLASTAQDSAVRQEQLNDQLRADLACRAQGSTDYDLAKGNVIARLAETLAHFAAGEDIADETQAIIDAVEELDQAGDQRQAILDECSATVTSD